MNAAQIRDKYQPKNIQETIQVISKILTKKRWVKNVEQERSEDYKDWNFCLIGATYFVDGEFERAAMKCIKNSLPPVPNEYKLNNGYDKKDLVSWDGIPDFNDWEGTTYGKVKAVLKRAEELAKKMDKERKKKAAARRGK